MSFTKVFVAQTVHKILFYCILFDVCVLLLIYALCFFLLIVAIIVVSVIIVINAEYSYYLCAVGCSLSCCVQFATEKIFWFLLKLISLTLKQNWMPHHNILMACDCLVQNESRNFGKSFWNSEIVHKKWKLFYYLVILMVLCLWNTKHEHKDSKQNKFFFERENGSGHMQGFRCRF